VRYRHSCPQTTTTYSGIEPSTSKERIVPDPGDGADAPSGSSERLGIDHVHWVSSGRQSSAVKYEVTILLIGGDAGRTPAASNTSVQR